MSRLNILQRIKHSNTFSDPHKILRKIFATTGKSYLAVMLIPSNDTPCCTLTHGPKKESWHGQNIFAMSFLFYCAIFVSPCHKVDRDA
jgi:hypothetical protein